MRTIQNADRVFTRLCSKQQERRSFIMPGMRQHLSSQRAAEDLFVLSTASLKLPPPFSHKSYGMHKLFPDLG